MLTDFLTSDPGNRNAMTLLVENLFGQQEFNAVLALVREVHVKHDAHDPSRTTPLRR